VLETELVKKKAETLKKLEEGARLKGVVKNITDYGVFIDLGGIDGLLHITDISWGRVNHPSEHFSVGDEVEVVILKFDPETERVSLGYKQKGDDPWTLVDKKYPIGSRVRGRVVSLVDYGAFVEIEEGVEGLIHVSEMSWTKKVVNPAKILEVGDEVEAIVSELDMDQRRISLSLRQTERNPWEELADTHPEGTVIEGKVRNLTEFGAFVEITEGIDGLIHVSDMSWTKRVKHPSEVLKKGDVVKARITNIDVENQRVSLSIKEFMPNEWDDFARQHKVGDVLSGRIVNVTDFGLFIDIYNGLEGLAHVSEIDVPGGAKLEDRFAVGDYVRTRILRIEEDDKKVGLSMRGVTQPSPNEVSELKAEAAARRHQASGSASSAGSAANGAPGAAATAHDASEAHQATPAHEANAVATADTEDTVAAPAASASTAEPGRGGKRREAKKQQQPHDEHAGSSE
jgi:small subunit ribosomal protein S1